MKTQSSPDNHAKLGVVKQVIGVIAGLVVLGGLIYLAFVYIPSRPSNIYAQGMRSVGRGIDHLLQNDLLPELSNVKHDAVVKFSIEDNDALNLKLTGQADAAGNNVLKLSSDQGLNTDILLAKEANGRNLYMRPDPLMATMLLQLVPNWKNDPATIRSVSNQWWRFDNQLITLYDELANTPANQEASVASPAYNEIVELTFQLLQKYVFTDKQSKMIFQLNEVLGEEDFDGRASYKYDVNINQENMIVFLKQWRDQLSNSQAVADMDAQSAWTKWLRSSTYTSELNQDELADMTIRDMLQTLFSDTEIEAQVQHMVDAFKVTVWIDVENRLLRNLRLSATQNNRPVHYDFGLRLQDDQIRLNIGYRVEPNTTAVTTDDADLATTLATALFADTTFVMQLNMVIDTEAKKINHDWQFDLIDENDKEVLGVQIILAATESDQTIQINVPTNARSFSELLQLIAAPSNTSPPTETTESD